MFAAFRAAALSAAALLFAVVFTVALTSSAARAQDRVWLQIEAQPQEATALERAAAYAAFFPETHGFKLKSGWYAIVLGPYKVAEGAAKLNALRSENLIPADSFIAEESDFIVAFWPLAGASATVPEVTTEAVPEPAIEPEVEPAPDSVAAEPVVEPAEAPASEPEETLQEARASEATLSADDRKLLQTALQWFGFYPGGIDGAYGKGTRTSMAAWQEALGLDVTGTLTTRQRATLVANYQAEIAEFGFAPVTEAEAGIQLTLPLALIEFDHYEPPFVHYRAKNGSNLTLVLISQPGDVAALHGLYDVLQTLDAMPTMGERDKTDRDFRIHGTSATRDTHAYAMQKGGTIKGYMLISAPGQEDRDARIREVLAASFASTGAATLDPGMVTLDDSARRGLLAGLEVRKPRFSRSGFFVDATGNVVTTAEAVTNCGRITLEREFDATVKAVDAGLGLAILTPGTQLAPSSVATFQTAADRIGAEISVAGYSYEDRLPAPVLTFGALEASSDLGGDAGFKRLTLTALPGDTGGPVVDGTGAVLGLLLPAPTAGATGGQELPAGVAFAASSAKVAGWLKAEGLQITEADQTEMLSPAALSDHARGMTVLVSCWQ
ncbi:MAG: trypsin-like peptidase domain-containing protein [Paracoccaceae bacterium]